MKTRQFLVLALLLCGCVDGAAPNDEVVWHEMTPATAIEAPYPCGSFIPEDRRYQHNTSQFAICVVDKPVPNLTAAWNATARLGWPSWRDHRDCGRFVIPDKITMPNVPVLAFVNATHMLTLETARPNDHVRFEWADYEILCHAWSRFDGDVSGRGFLVVDIQITQGGARP